MATTLCETCFPQWEEREVFSIVPMSPCEGCGQQDESHRGGLRAHLFPGDPRKAEPQPASAPPTP